jgi:hypothetical protein
MVISIGNARRVQSGRRGILLGFTGFSQSASANNAVKQQPETGAAGLPLKISLIIDADTTMPQRNLRTRAPCRKNLTFCLP